jgi:FtsH-binding integral membrane protein
LPIALEFAQAVGWATGHWQGRYALAFAVGVPLLATMSLERDGPGARLSASLLPVGLAIALGVASVFAFAQNLRRYTVGYDGHVWYFLDPQWSPPGGALLITVGFTVAMGLTIAWLLTGTTQDAAPVPDPVATPAPFGVRSTYQGTSKSP